MHTDATFKNGTLAASINTAGKFNAGIVFGADEQATSYYLFRLCDNQNVELVKVVNGVATILDRGYLSAGHNYNAYNRLEAVRNGNVMDTSFYAKIEGSTLYVNTLERFEQGMPALTTVDLTSNGKFPLFASGYTGVLSWTDAVAFNLEISQYVA